SSSSGGEPGCPEECGEHATCVDPMAGCRCDPGYEGDGSMCTLVPMLPPLAWQLDCMGSSPSCTGDATCAVEAPFDEHQVTRTAFSILEGDPAILYDVTLRMRAVIEPKDYDGGESNAHWNEGGTPVPDDRNVAYLSVDNPSRLIYVNAG